LVDGLAADAPRELADGLLVRRHVAGVGAAEEERHPERLGLPDRHVRPEVARGLEYGERDRVAHGDAQRADAVRRLGRRPHVLDDAEEVRALNEDTGDVVRQPREVRDPVPEWQLDDLDPVGLYNLPVAGVQALRDGDLRVALRQAGGHEGGLGDRAGAIVDRGVRDLQAGEF